MSKAGAALEAVSNACNAVSAWMDEKEELGEEEGDTDYFGNPVYVGDFMVDWLEQLGQIHDRILEYADKWGDLDEK